MDTLKPAFQTFTRGGIRFLSVPTDRGNVSIIDSAGNNYGSYYDVHSFESMAARHHGFAALVLGKASLSVVTHRP